MILLACLAFLAAAAPAMDVAPARSRADLHFLAGFDYFRAGKAEDARREWKACRELDETHDFCEFGLSVLDAGAPRAADERPVTESVPEAPPVAVPDASRAAQQHYLDGVIYFQKGDYEKTRASWVKAKALAPAGSAVAKDTAAGLERLDLLYGVKVESGAPAPLRDMRAEAEKKDEHQALQTYFTGLIHFQKGDMVKARMEWLRALALAPKGSSVESDAKAALEKLDKEEASTRRDSKK